MKVYDEFHAAATQSHEMYYVQVGEIRFAVTWRITEDVARMLYHMQARTEVGDHVIEETRSVTQEAIDGILDLPPFMRYTIDRTHNHLVRGVRSALGIPLYQQPER